MWSEHIETELEGSSRRTSDWDARSEVGTGPWLWLGMFLVAGMLGRGLDLMLYIIDLKYEDPVDLSYRGTAVSTEGAFEWPLQKEGSLVGCTGLWLSLQRHKTKADRRLFWRIVISS